MPPAINNRICTLCICGCAYQGECWLSHISVRCRSLDWNPSVWEHCNCVEGKPLYGTHFVDLLAQPHIHHTLTTSLSLYSVHTQFYVHIKVENTGHQVDGGVPHLEKTRGSIRAM